MIILDTNIIAEFIQSEPAAAVVDWMNAIPLAAFHTTAINVGEQVFGLENLRGVNESRRAVLQRDFELFLHSFVPGRVLDFDALAAREWGKVLAENRRGAHERRVADTQIAAIARAHVYKLATRYRRDFEGLGVDLINPFEHRG
ncbi:MAG: PIN domain-containing protein [Alphaproteobacteria bacterium]|jgi:predicted nucleic acid-binding protein|nr:PIN domain-containing protein [Alphaproteobacteria bacterium]